MLFELTPLPYEIDALEPYISERTLELHYGKLQETYVHCLNNLVKGTKFEDSELETIIRVSDGSIFNNASQVFNHTFYFDGLISADKSCLRGPFMRVLTGNFGSVQFLKDSFIKCAASLFGSGWVWLLLNPKGTIEIIHESNAGNPLRRGLKPLLTCDLWEHGYFLDYQNRRPDYVNAFWNVINWKIIEERYDNARNDR